MLGQRVLVSGSSASGKTTLARWIEARSELVHHELDALHHGPNWLPRATFRKEVETFVATDQWVTEDQYSSVLGELLWQRADMLVWLDLPRRVVMLRVIRRSIARAALRTELWNGNRENWRHWRDHDHPIRWTWAHHGERRRQTLHLIERHPHVRVTRLRTARQVRHWRHRVGYRSGGG